MSIDIPLELDTGPITWVKPEIEASLGRVLSGIAASRERIDPAVCKSVARELHAVAGAFELVGVEGLTVLVREFEWHFGQDAPGPSPQAMDHVERGVRRLLAHLQEMVAGAPAVPVRFLPEYVALGKLRDARLGPVDLFFPDLNRKPPTTSARREVDPTALPGLLLRKRREFQQGFLGWLRGNPDGLAAMREALQGIESAYPLPAQRAFWWTSRALVRAIEARLLEPSVAVKQLFARVDLQIRRFVEGSTRVADRLRREVLYHLARSADGDALVDEVKSLYELSVLIPRRVPVELDYVAIQPVIEQLKAAIDRAKDRWGAVGGPMRDRGREELVATVGEIAALTEKIRLPEFARLGQALVGAVGAVRDDAVSDDLSIEVASTLILIETAAAQIASLPRSFARQADAAVQRLQFARNGIAIPPMLRDEGEPDSLTRRAQERATVAQVVREIRANMRSVEHALDAAYRDRGAAEELAPVPALLAQVSGALQILGWTRANDILTETSARLLRAIQSDQPIGDRTINEHADILAGLTFYIDAREQREQEADAMLGDLERRLRGEPPLPPGVPDGESVEASIAGHSRQLRESLDRTSSSTPTGAAREAVLAIRHDAELLADTKLIGAADQALAALDRGNAGGEALDALLSAADASAPVPEASEASWRLATARDDERDSGLLAIFCEEAQEVLTTLNTGLADLRALPSDRSALATVRRAFHTLKGSGRMVGLGDFGEAAWQIERVLNGILEADRSIHPHETSMLVAATAHFERWIGELAAQGSASVDVSLVRALVEADGRDHGLPTSEPASAPLPRLEATAVPAAAKVAPDLTERPANEVVRTVPASFAGHADLPELELDSLSVAEAPQSLTDPLPPTTSSQVEASFELPALVPTDDDAVSIDGISVPRTLFSILVDEARVHLQTLEQELAVLQFDPEQHPSPSMIRAAHTLCGIHRTAGLTDIGELAGETESALVSLAGSGRDPEAHALLASAIAALRTAALRVQTLTPMRDEERRSFSQALASMRALTSRLGARRHDAVAAAMAATTDVHDPTSLAPAPAPAQNLAGALLTFAPPADDANEFPSAENIVVEDVPPAVQTPFPEPWPLESMPAGAPAGGASEAARAVPVSGFHAPQIDDPGAKVDAGADSEPSLTSTNPATDARIAAGPTDGAPTARSGMAGVEAAPIAASALAAIAAAGAATTMTAPQAPTVGAVRTDDPLADIRDEVDEQVLAIFLEESQELYPAANEQARAMRAAPGDVAVRSAIKRTLHTLKGSARMAGAMRLGEIIHLLETRIVEAPVQPEASFFDGVDEALDDIAFLLDRHSRGEHNVVLPRYRAEAQAESAATPEASPQRPELPSRPVQPAAMSAPSLDAGVDRLAPPVTPVPIGQAAGKPAPVAEAAYLRVRADTLESLADEAGEIAIARARIESELRELKSGLLDLTTAVVRLRAQLREIEIQGESQIQSRLDEESRFDPLEFDRYTRFQELTRGLAEGVNDVATVQQNLLKNLADADASLAAQMRLSRSVQLRLQSMRTVPFSTLSDRLYRVLRQTAKELGKRANLDIRGGRIEVDRSVLERLAPVIEHLVRNALAHGLETPQERTALGKPATGQMMLSVTQQGNEVVIELADDGAGIPLAKIEARARALGMLPEGVTASAAELTELIFQPGFSTAESVSAIAGRGIGMDVVRSEVTALGGRVEVRTEPERGTRFALRVPLTLAVTQVLLVRTGDTAVGIPASLIETVRQIRAGDCEEARRSGTLEHLGRPIPYFVLTSLYDRVPQEAGEQRTRSVAVLRSGDLVAAFELEAVIGNQEVVAKPYGPQLARVRGLAGLTVLGDGSIVILSNPLQLMPSVIQAAEHSRLAMAATAGGQAHGPAVLPPVHASGTDLLSSTADAVAPAVAALPTAEVIPLRPELAPQSRIPLVLVVDDSLTVRKITTRLLEREGYRVITAKDGLDAIQVLADHQPDVILLDIEMPRMDGFEFARTVRSDTRQKSIPIIMITSRTADKHRAHARELGVEEYLGKPYQDDQLLQLIVQYTGGVGSAVH